MVFGFHLYGKVVLFVFWFFFVYGQVFGLERCNAIASYIKDAHFFYFGVDFPWWYSVAQAEKESRCRHNVISTDGVGSEGFAQITWRWWRVQLEQEGITEIKSLKNHAKAQAYINYRAYRESRCKKLFEMYQIYNGGGLVSKEVYPICTWEYGLSRCKRKDICVMFKQGQCVQYRNACDINYSYSRKIFELAQKYRRVGSDGKYKFW